MNLHEKLRKYTDRFRKLDEELYQQEISNDEAYEWMKDNIPLIECPDKTLEEIYYFRWWVYRKHIKRGKEGYLITEFLPPVPWAGPYNSINCAAGFHIREGRWIKNTTYLKDTIRFWLEGCGDNFSYSAWFAAAVWDFCTVTGEFDFGLSLLEKMIWDYGEIEKRFLMPSDLYWSEDDRDCMEMSISGSGLRPTRNSYQYGNAVAISNFARLFGEHDLEARFLDKAEKIKNAVQKFLWRDNFFRVYPQTLEGARSVSPDFAAVDQRHDVREEIGFIPWYFNMPDKGYESAFGQLKDHEGFAGKWGFTTAERRHARYRYPHIHECLWNGPVWPYATTQTLVAAANLLNNYNQDVISAGDYYQWLRQYAYSQRRETGTGRVLPWIDEDQDPDTGIWLSREQLEQEGWPSHKGGYERGKDYNHSMFCDLILHDLFGIHTQENGKIEISPLIPADWDGFRVEQLHIWGKEYRICYKKGTSVEIFT